MAAEITTVAKNQIGMRKEIWKFGILPAGGISLFPAHILAASCQGRAVRGLVASLSIARRDILGLVYAAAYMRACVLRPAMP